MTRIMPEEYKYLVPVPPEMWGWKQFNKQTGKEEYAENSLGSCDVDMNHGRAHYFLMSPDKRAIAACSGCFKKIEAAIGG